MIREITKGPHPQLREMAAICEPGEDAIKLLVDMIDTMVANEGAGLAAPQVGESKRAIVVHDVNGGTVWAILNPRISDKSAIKIKSKEGCLSYPGLKVEKKRAYSCKVEGFSGNGTPISIRAKGELSCIFQHEVDHLNGITIA